MRVELEQWAQEGRRCLYPDVARVTVGMATCGRAAGAAEVYSEFERLIKEQDPSIMLEEVGCAGMCWAEPQVEITLPGQARAVYGFVEAEQVSDMVEGILNGALPSEGLIGWIERDEHPALGQVVELGRSEGPLLEEQPFRKHQRRIVGSNSGLVAIGSSAQYAATGGYRALERALKELSPEEVLELVDDAGLRGRGGAGFPTGKKWRSAREAESDQKYVVANADEGDPGAYMDRGLLESDPHRVLEGLALSAYAVGARKGFVFTRSEYSLAVAVLERAIADAEECGFIGSDVLGTGWSFTVDVVRSAGAYVCGEESAMIQAMEGRRGDPEPRPPYPTQQGLWGKPTCVNNVETLANVPLIVLRGAEWFKSLGSKNNPGTKIFSLVGSIERTGLIEVPMGTSIRQVVDEIGGHDEELRAVQIGGPSGAILPMSMGDLPLDYEGLARCGAIMGSGGIVVLGKQTCVVDTTRYFVNFSANESCGKCPACRDGLAECLALLDKAVDGTACPDDLAKLELLAREIPTASLCGLGKSSLRPLATSLRYFREEYEAHLAGECPGHVCKPLIHFKVIANKCPGCRCCIPTCPTAAMQGKYGKPYEIIDRLCTKCWMCTYTCPYDAVLCY